MAAAIHHVQRDPFSVVAAQATVAAGSRREATFQFSGPSDIQRWTPDCPAVNRVVSRASGVNSNMVRNRRTGDMRIRNCVSTAPMTQAATLRAQDSGRTPLEATTMQPAPTATKDATAKMRVSQTPDF